MSKTKSIIPSQDGQRTLLLGQGVSSAEQFLLRPIFMMCEPNYFDPRSIARPEQENIKLDPENDNHFDAIKAHEQHRVLRQAYLDMGCSIILNKGECSLIDGVYKADPSISNMTVTTSPKGKITSAHFDTVLSKFSLIRRSPEVIQQLGDIKFLQHILAERFQVSASSCVMSALVHGEGTGDNVYDPYRDVFWCGNKPKTNGYSVSHGRSDPKFHEILAQTFSAIERTRSLEVDNGHFHIDTSLSPLPKGDVIIYRGGITPNAFENLKNSVGEENLILVSKKDAYDYYGCNSVITNGNNIVMPKTTPELHTKITSRGYHAEQIELDQFIMSGGAAHCLVNRVNQMRRDNYKDAVSTTDTLIL